MADADNATRAPESDAQENVAPTAPAPVVGEHCVTDRPTRMLQYPTIIANIATNGYSFGSGVHWRDDQAQRR
ncbi:hypothetical protein AUP68_01812 [Ilyonectria robusta]